MHSHFKKQPFWDTRAIVYDGSPARQVAAHYGFVHPLSEAMTAILCCGLSIEKFREFRNNISFSDFDILQKEGPILPLSY